ncbi:MAG: aminopeptidase C [Hyphomicrobiales bacterium]
MKHLKSISLGIILSGLSMTGYSQSNNGAIDQEVLKQIKGYVKENSADKARLNAISSNKIRGLAFNRENYKTVNHYISNRVNVKGITNQKSSGRCWLFTGLNSVRPAVIDQYGLGSFEYSQTYNFFFDQLEKCNLFLEGIISTADLDIKDRKVDWFLKNPLSDGGQWTTFADNVKKYGVVPKNVMPETYHSQNTGEMGRLIKRKLREDAIRLRNLYSEKKNKEALKDAKVAMLGDIYRILTFCLGEPPVEFTWQYKDKDGKISELEKYTPQSFFKKHVAINIDDYIMIMNDPTRPFYQVYEIEYDRSLVDGKNWKYLNLPIKDIEEFAKASILANQAMYFSCDVGKQLNRDYGTLDMNNYDYTDLFGVKFGMNKSERIKTYDSGSSHAMTLVGCNITKDDKVDKWLIENSWGASHGHNGYLTMTSEWFKEYLFRLVVDKKYLSKKALKALDKKSTLLPPWDPMFAPEM